MQTLVNTTEDDLVVNGVY